MQRDLFLMPTFVVLTRGFCDLFAVGFFRLLVLVTTFPPRTRITQFQIAYRPPRFTLPLFVKATCPDCRSEQPAQHWPRFKFSAELPRAGDKIIARNGAEFSRYRNTSSAAQMSADSVCTQTSSSNP